jgi:hypothetical protein
MHKTTAFRPAQSLLLALVHHMGHILYRGEQVVLWKSYNA